MFMKKKRLERQIFKHRFIKSYAIGIKGSLKITKSNPYLYTYPHKSEENLENEEHKVFFLKQILVGQLKGAE